MKATLLGEITQIDEIDLRPYLAQGLTRLYIDADFLWIADVPLGAADLENLSVAWEDSLDVARAFASNEKDGPFGTVLVGETPLQMRRDAFAACVCECGQRWAPDERITHSGGCPECTEE